MISLLAKLTVREGKEQDFIDAMKDVVPAVREEPGNSAYVMNRSKRKSEHVCVLRRVYGPGRF